MLRLRFLLMLATLSICAPREPAVGLTAPPDTLHDVHDALFSSFIPVEELKGDPTLSEQLNQIRDGIWKGAQPSAEFRGLLVPFADLRGFGNSCGVLSYLRGAASWSLSDLSLTQRAHVLFLLGTCNENGPARLAMTVRNFYIVKTYSAIQEPLANVHLNLYASHEWNEQHRPRLPPSHLRYDAKLKSITLDSGPIDYLIVGSGPAGSVLAHELRRGGHRVLLVERGSFIVPGSMQTRLIDELIDSRTSKDGGVVIHNGMAVGGGSQVNVDLCFSPTLPSIYARIDGWRRDGRIGADEFTKGQLATAYKWVKGAIGTRTLSESEINANNGVLWSGAQREGLHPKLYDLNTYAPANRPIPRQTSGRRKASF